jgi:hypothetical protein
VGGKSLCKIFRFRLSCVPTLNYFLYSSITSWWGILCPLKLGLRRFHWLLFLYLLFYIGRWDSVLVKNFYHWVSVIFVLDNIIRLIILNLDFKYYIIYFLFIGIFGLLSFTLKTAVRSIVSPYISTCIPLTKISLSILRVRIWVLVIKLKEKLLFHYWEVK